MIQVMLNNLITPPAIRLWHLDVFRDRKYGIIIYRFRDAQIECGQTILDIVQCNNCICRFLHHSITGCFRIYFYTFKSQNCSVAVAANDNVFVAFVPR